MSNARRYIYKNKVESNYNENRIHPGLTQQLSIKRRFTVTVEEMEAKIKALEEQVKIQGEKLAILDDIEAIQRLQKAYNY